MPTISHVRRKRGPAIAWTPTDEFNSALAATQRGAVARTPPLYLTQSAILEIDAHLRDSTSPAPFGLLVGALCISPQESVVYLLIDTVTRSRTELSESDPYVQLASELRSLAAQQEKQGKLAIGWYLGGMADDLTLDSDVRGLHRELFPEPRHVLLLRGEVDEIEHGAFLRFDGSSESPYPVPFFELLPDREIRKNGERHTVIRWNEYRTNALALSLRESEASSQQGDVASPGRWGATGLSTSLESFRQGLRSAPREKPSAAQATTGTPPQERAVERVRVERADVHQAPASVPKREVAPPVGEIPGALAVATPGSAEPQRPAATPPPSGSELRAHARLPTRDPTPRPVEHVNQSPTASIEANGARPAPPSDLQHIFIDGTLVPVRWTHRFNRKSRVLAAIRRVRIAPLLMLTLVMLVVAILYRFVR